MTLVAVDQSASGARVTGQERAAAGGGRSGPREKQLSTTGETAEAPEFSVLMAPMNFAMMPITLVNELKRRGYRAKHIWYSNRDAMPFGFESDEVVRLRDFRDRHDMQTQTLKRLLDEDWDVFHFWNKSLFFAPRYGDMTGLDLPFIRARGKSIVWRFTGADLRLASADMAINPHSAYRYGLEHPFDEDEQRAFLEFLQCHVDQFIVPDAELGLHMPEAKIIPRALELSEWSHTGFNPDRRDKPLILHAPSRGAVKGSSFVQKAIEELHDEGLSFEHRYLEGVSHDEIKRQFANADIIVDQLHTGMGVTTLEAWACGKAVVTNMREEVFGTFYGGGMLPAAEANPDTIKDVLRKLVKDADWRQALGEAGRAAVERYHDVNKIVDDHIDVYRECLSGQRPRSKSTADIGYIFNDIHAKSVETVELRKQLYSLEFRFERLQASANEARAAHRAEVLDLQRLQSRAGRGGRSDGLADARSSTQETRALRTEKSRLEQLIRDERRENQVYIDDIEKRLEQLFVEKRQLEADNTSHVETIRAAAKHGGGAASAAHIEILQTQVRRMRSELARVDDELARTHDKASQAALYQERMLRERQMATEKIEKLERRLRRFRIIEDRFRDIRRIGGWYVRMYMKLRTSSAGKLLRLP